MTERSRLRPLVVFVLAITSIAVAGIFFSTTTSSGPLTTKLDHLHELEAKPQEYDQNGEHVLVIPYYNLSDGWTSTLLLTNQAPTETEIGITLYALDGQRLDGPTVTLKPHAAGQLSWVNIRRGTMEQDAHSVSDPIVPQYAYQYCQ